LALLEGEGGALGRLAADFRDEIWSPGRSKESRIRQELRDRRQGIEPAAAKPSAPASGLTEFVAVWVIELP